MEKDKMLLAGLGQCGCNLASEMITKNKRYAGIFINSSLGDLVKTPHRNDNNTFIFNGTDGAGRNRKLAQSFVENDILRLSTFLTKFTQFKAVTIFSSLDGGTGSGSLPYVVKTFRKIMPTLKVIVVGVIPNIEEDNLKLQNTLDCCAEIEASLEFINSIRFIDNSTRDNYKEINSEAVEIIDLSYSIVGRHGEDSIDLEDSMNVNTSDGYLFTLKLPDRYSSIEEALTVAKESSVFALPNSFDCVYGAVNVKEGVYDRNLLKKSICADKTVYTTYNNKFNLMSLGGCDMPSEVLENIKSELTDRARNKTSRNVKRGFGLGLEVKNNAKNIEAKTNVIEEEDIDSLFDADFFRF